MKTSSYWLCAAALLAAVTPAMASSASWNGTWKLDPAKSQLTGDTFTYSMNPNGTIHYTNGGPVQFDFSCDGKDYTELADYTTSCKQVSDTVYSGTEKKDGKVLSTWQRVISPDGKTMTITSKGTRPDGTAFTNVNTYERVSGTSGLAGKWKNLKSTSSVAGLMTISRSGSEVTLRYPHAEQVVTAKLDGSPAPLTGPTLPPGVTVSIKPVGSNAIDEVTTFKGKVFAEDMLTLNSDGTTITDVSTTPGQSDKQTYVYEKQ